MKQKQKLKLKYDKKQRQQEQEFIIIQLASLLFHPPCVCLTEVEKITLKKWHLTQTTFTLL